MYTVRDVARTLGLTPARVRAWARAGLIEPRRAADGQLRFSFQDLVLLRTARDLVAARVPPPRVRRALASLRAQLPAGHSLAGVRVTADGDRVVVRQGGARWQADSGQVLLDFEVRDVAAEVAPLVRDAVRAAGSPADVDAMYDLGCDLEDGAPGQARAAYARALALDPAHYGAHLNLGRLLHEAGELAAAERHYRAALEARPGDARALFNLGVALEDAGRLAEALAAYEDSVAADPRGEDAHHNAARLCERLGRREQAVRHLGAAHRLARSPR